MKKTSPAAQATASTNKPTVSRLRRQTGLMALEQRFMFDGAAASELVSVGELVDLQVDHWAQTAEKVQEQNERALAADFVGMPLALTGLSEPAAALVIKSWSAAQADIADFLQDDQSADALAQIFGDHRADSDQADGSVQAALRELVRNGALDVKLSVLDGQTLQGALGAFTAKNPDGQMAIYLNRDWLEGGASTELLQRVLIEELGHALDAQLRPSNDAQGDEGKRFAALVCGASSDTQVWNENDHFEALLDGQAIQFEAALPVFDVNFNPLSFATGSHVAGTDKAVGDTYLYTGVFTTATGQKIDAVVSMTELSNASLSSFDSTANPYATTASFQPNLTFSAVGGYATFNFKFILGGTYQSAANPGSAVELRNVVVNSYDLDGSGSSASGRQFTDFSDIGGYTVSSSTKLLVQEPSAGVTRFLTTIGGNITASPGTAAADDIRVRVTFDQFSTFSVKVGDNGASGLAYFGIDFSQGATFTNAKVSDISVIANGNVVTSEGGTSDSFTVALQSAPAANVTVSLTGLDPTEGTLSASTLTFTPTNWNTPQTVTVTGVDDAPVDGDITYTLTATAASTDIAYKGRTAVIDVVNADNDVPVPLTVNNILVNEASAYGVFEVSGDANSVVTLALAAGTSAAATGAGTDYSAASGSGLQYLLNGTWTVYSANASVSLDSTGKLLVRTAIVNDGVSDNNETFKLNATEVGGVTATGTATIKDDGTGTIFKNDGTDDTTAVRDDDRALAVNSIMVNEASPYAVFEVTGAVDQLTKLVLAAGNSPSAAGTGTDYSSATGTGLQYLVGSTWTDYTANATVSLGSTGKLLVRTAIVNDSLADNSETFKLNATNTGGTTASGLATIKDDGTGTIFKNDGTDDTTAVRDDDRALTVSDIMVNEASPYAVFTVTGGANQSATLALATSSLNPASGAAVDYSAATGTGLEYWSGSAWLGYTTDLKVSLGASGVLMVRTQIVNDAVSDNAETFKLNVTNSGGSTASGIATIKDDGTGTIFKNDGTDDTAAVRDDDRALAVNSITVNEASPHAVFEVTGAVNQLTRLALAASGTSPAATSGGTDYSAATGTGLQYLVGGTWTTYADNAFVSLGAAGKLLVRTAIVNDSLADNNETFKLNATNTAGAAASGVATIKDDGTGDIFKNDGTKDLAATKDDDRALAVNNITVNEASPYAVFEVTGAANQLTSLALAAGSTLPASGSGVDYGTTSGSGLEYWTGSTWSAYTSGLISLNGSGVLLVRTPVINDSAVDGGETFKLTATNTGGVIATGIATITDDGTGTIYKPDGTVDPSAPKDDDAYVALPTVNSITVNEASPYAVLQVTGQLGQMVTLSLVADSATPDSDYTPSMKYSSDGGSTWADYAGAAVALSGTGGTLLVRVPVLPDTSNEPDETFVLKVTTTASTFSTGTVSIVDDANGTIFNADGTENTSLVKDDDRVITITSPDVNEGSPSALFVLTGAPGQDGFIYDGATLIHSFTFGTSGSYGFFYSYTSEQETAVDGPESKTLTVKTQSGTASTGTATLRDDGTGSYWAAGNANPLTAAQLVAADVALDDDRALTVNSFSVNEASPYAVFDVTGAAGQRVSLALASGSSNPATGNGTDYSQSTGAALQYFDGANWVNYTAGTAGAGAGINKYSGTVALDASGHLMVRTRIVNDAINDNNQTFKLEATNTGGSTAAGEATIQDDGTGTIFKDDGTNDSTVLPDDDRAVTVTGTTVNEASSHVVFTVTGLGGQLVQLSLTESGSGNGHAVIGTDTGLASQLEYLDGTTWKSYTGGYVTLPGSGATSMLVRVVVKNDALNEGSETLKLIASTTGVSANGLSTIKDDSTGSTVTFDGTSGQPSYTAGSDATLDDDRPLTIAEITVLESGGHAVFNVNGFGGQYVKLALISGTAESTADFSPAIEYYNGTTWVNYSANDMILIPGSVGVPVVLQVRTNLVRDSIEEPTEQFRLVVTNSGGTEGRGTASITDNIKPALAADSAIAVEQGGSANATAGVNPGGNLVAGTVVSGNLGVGGADSDADGDSLTVSSVANTAVSATVVTTPTASAVNVQGLYGVLSVNNEGAYTYTVTNTNADVQALRSSADTLTETFTYKVSDGWGGESTSTLTVTIRGANDAPVAVADFNVSKESLAGTIVGTADYSNVIAYSTGSGATYDALGYKATGSVLPNDTDVDGNDARTVLDAKVTGVGSATTVTSSGVTLTGTHGDLVIRADGTYTYTPTANSTALSEGQFANDVFVYTLQDAAGETSTANLTITVYGSGSNDPDAVDDANTVVEAGGSTSAVAATGNVLENSVSSPGDLADTTPTGTTPLVVSDARSTSASAFTAVSTSTVINGQYGVLTISSTGAYSYDLTNTLTDVQGLQAGQTLSESFIYQVKNGPFGDPAQRRIDSANLTITITGTNDAPTLDLDTTTGAPANFSATFTEGGQAVSLSTAAGVNLADVDSTSFANVTVTIAQAQVRDGSSEELLLRGATSGGSLTLGDFTASSGSVTLGGLVYSYERTAPSGNLTFVFKGPAGAELTTDQAESLLDAMTYQNTSDNPTVSGTRVFTLSVTDSGSLTSNTATSTISVVAVNDVPVLDLDANDSSTATGANYRVNYSISGAAVAVADADRLVSDVDNTLMESATLVLTNAQANDVLTAGTMPSGIAASVGALTSGQITVTLTGSATKSSYEEAIRAITFSTTSANLTPRDVQVLVSDGALSTNLGTTSIVVSPDDRPLSVTGTNVNEKSPFVVFTVSGAANQKVSLQLASTGSTAGHASLSIDTANANTTFVLQYLSGSTWTNYTPGDAVALDNAGNLLVRTAVENDAVSEGVESLQLIARNGAGTANATPGMSTIRDDGQGGYFADENTTTTSDVPGGVVLDDDRPLAVNNLTVNEASPYAVFEVTGVANQLTSLSLGAGTATDGGTDYSSVSGTGLQYLLGSTWTSYSAGDQVSLGAAGKLLVRTAIINDTTLDNSETFKLLATNTGGVGAVGLATIKDDGTGDVFKNDGAVNPNALKDDDRNMTVNSITVNEASPYAVFEVSGFAGQKTSLVLLAGSASGAGVDYSAANGSGLQYLSGSSWVAYGSGTLVALDGAGKLLVRTAITNDSVSDDSETFSLKVTATGGSTDTGLATIKDDGTGTIYRPDGRVDEQAIKDDDRPVTVTSPTVNEASPYAVFTVGGASNQWVSLDLSATGSTAGHAAAGTDYTALVQTSFNGGLTWTTYTDGVNLNGSGSLLVRIPVLQDSVNEVDETFKLTVGNAGGAQVVGTATIQDDGNGTIYKPDGSLDTTTPKDDDRGFGVSSPMVNEASPYAVFVVDGEANQALTGLTLLGGTATSLDFGDSLEISSNNGSTWISYTGGNFTLNGAGQLWVRTPVKPDAFVDNNETFTLTVSSSVRSSVGTATIMDDGTGTVFRADNGQPDPAAQKDNDAPRVTGTTVNEASPYVMWTVSDVVEGQDIKLSLMNTAATTDNDAELVLGNDPADVGSTLQYWNGSVWTNYQPGQNGGFVSVPSDGDSTAGEAATLKVRLAVINDVGLPVFEGAETLVLKAEVATGQNSLGTSTIVDDGTGSRFDFDGPNDSDPTETTGPGTGFDDDRSLIVYDTTVNEGSPYAVFRVAAVPGMRLILELSNGSATSKTGTSPSALDGSQDFGPSMQYFDGLSWVDYAPNSVYIVPTGSRITLVRTPVINDTVFENREDFALTVRTEDGSVSDAGTGAIIDDGTNVIFNESGAEDRFVAKNDDRTLKVNSIEVNEGSAYGVFTVNGTAGGSVNLALSNSVNALDTDAVLSGEGRDTSDADAVAGVAMQYTLDGGLNWINYSGTAFSIPSDGQFFVRTGIYNDLLKEGAETFQLVVTTADSAQAVGLATIFDDGSGKKFPGTITAGQPDTNTMDLDDDFDKDGVPPTVEEILATMAASVGWSTSLLGDLNGDGLQDAEQNALATLAWTTVDKYQEAMNGTLTSIRPIISLAVMPGDTGTAVSTVAQLENIKVLSPTDASVGGSKPTGPNIEAPWDPIQFSIAKQPGAADANLMDVNSSRAGLQVRVLIDVSAAQMPDTSFNAYMKYVSAEAFAALSTGTLDNAGTPITGAGWYDFTQRVVGGDGARFITSNGLLTAIELIITDNAFGDNNLAVGGVTDPGLPVKITVTEPVVMQPPAPVEPTPVTPPALVIPALTVSSVAVNEASPYAVFVVGGQAGQVATLILANGTAGSADFGPGLEVFVGTQWLEYTGQSVSLDAEGRLLVRTPVVNDGIFEGAETFNLIARNAASLAASGTATVRDDGSGDVYKADGFLDLSIIKDDDRPLVVSSPTVNEASPHAIFTVTGKAGQATSLLLTNGTAGAADYGPGLEVFNGTTWVPHDGQMVFLDAEGRLLVRTPVLNDGIFEGAESFSLTARNTGGQQAVGVATVRDDGKGDIWTVDGSLDVDRVKDDDRVLSVSSQTVNEASPFAFFTVSGQAGQVLTLKLNHGTAQATDYGPALEVFNGVTWELYTGQMLQLDADGQLRVRTSLVNDNVFEGAETFSLMATKTDGRGADGVITIMDDGTGDVLTPEGRPDALTVKDDDRLKPPVVVLPPVVPVVPSQVDSYPLSPERWMPDVGDVEFHKRWEGEQAEANDRHVPLRFDSALLPVLSQASVRDMGLTEPVEQDASQRLKSFDWTSFTEHTAQMASDSVDVRWTTRAKLASGTAGELPAHSLNSSLDVQSATLDLKRPAGDKPTHQKAVLPGRQAFSEKLKMAASAKLAERRSNT